MIRFEGPKGGPGMPEMLTPTSAIMGAGLGKDCALITDGRFSGGSHGFVIGHVTPEAQEGGPIALVGSPHLQCNLVANPNLKLYAVLSCNFTIPDSSLADFGVRCAGPGRRHNQHRWRHEADERRAQR